MKGIRLRPLAEADLIERTRFYRLEGDMDLGERFFDAAHKVLERIERQPGIGSLRIGEFCEIPNLRSYRVPGFPCGWFYFERSDHVDVVRLLSYSQDLAVVLGADTT